MSLRLQTCCCPTGVDSPFSPLSTKARTSASIVLRGANDFMCDEMERSLHDALCVVKRVLESKSVVTGGGAVEAALSIYLENYATSMVSRARLVPNAASRSCLFSSLCSNVGTAPPTPTPRAPGSSWPSPSSPAPSSSSQRRWR